MNIKVQTLSTDNTGDITDRMSKLFSEHFSELVREFTYKELREMCLKGSKRMLIEHPARCWFVFFSSGKVVAQGHTPGTEDTAMGRIDELTRLTTVISFLPVSAMRYSYLVEHPKMGPQLHVWTVGKKVSALEPWSVEPDPDNEGMFNFEPIEHDSLVDNPDVQIIMSRFGTFNSVFIASGMGRKDSFREPDEDVYRSVDYLLDRGFEVEMSPNLKKG